MFTLYHAELLAGGFAFSVKHYEKFYNQNDFAAGVVHLRSTRRIWNWSAVPIVMKHYSVIQYACAILLIASAICLVAYQVLTIMDVANGLLLYVAQAFLLAGSIFGLDYYVRQINLKLNDYLNNGNKRSKKQQPAKHTEGK